MLGIIMLDPRSAETESGAGGASLAPSLITKPSEVPLAPVAGSAGSTVLSSSLPSLTSSSVFTDNTPGFTSPGLLHLLSARRTAVRPTFDRIVILTRIEICFVAFLATQQHASVSHAELVLLVVHSEFAPQIYVERCDVVKIMVAEGLFSMNQPAPAPPREPASGQGFKEG
ncbi:hypothetical protein N7451_010728 [Penicillium sp. IBT 35674x]|nr:hypothetical protein N7451_010728 [Penicillium sp. IBT 35674x]